MKNWIFSHCFALKALPSRGSFLDLNLYFAFVYLFNYHFSKNIFEKNYLFSFKRLKTCNFFYIPMLPLTLFVINRHDYSFSTGKK